MKKTYKLLTILTFLGLFVFIQNDHCYGVESYKLYNEYETNEIAADLKWKGKRILLYGTIRAIGKNTRSRKSQGYIDIQSGRLPGKIRCWFEKEGDIAHLRLGNEVRIDGTVVGKERGYVTLEKCIQF